MEEPLKSFPVEIMRSEMIKKENTHIINTVTNATKSPAFHILIKYQLKYALTKNVNVVIMKN